MLAGKIKTLILSTCLVFGLNCNDGFDVFFHNTKEPEENIMPGDSVTPENSNESEEIENGQLDNGQTDDEVPEDGPTDNEQTDNVPADNGNNINEEDATEDSETISEIAEWVPLDGNSSAGLNKNNDMSAYSGTLTIFNSKLYAGWCERNEKGRQARIAVYKGDSNWKFIEGNGDDGLNKDASEYAGSPGMADYNSKLYAAWSEFDSVSGKEQIQAAVYNGDDHSPVWTFVNGEGNTGVNKTAQFGAFSPKLKVVGPKLYIIWNEKNSSGGELIRVAVYNSDDGSPEWNFIDGTGPISMNYGSLYKSWYPRPAEYKSMLCAVWTDNKRLRVALFNGDKNNVEWSLIQGDNSSGIDAYGAYSPVIIEFNEKLYAAWHDFYNSTGQIKIAVFNGNIDSPEWTFIDGSQGSNDTGINIDTSKDARGPELAVFNSKLYIAWDESNGTADQIRIAVYNGDDESPVWTFIDGAGLNGINYDITKNAYNPYLAHSNTGLYIIWNEKNESRDQIHVYEAQ